ncbi:MAG: hypothetical protein FJ312_04820 [SAR202 cluster bacterium]|nr:hypothetical protein [SAR202 cluster bacterium]
MLEAIPGHGERVRVLSPKEHLGFEVGEDRRLADWPQVVGYFAHLAEASPRVRTTELGKTTEGNPLLLSIISSPDNLACIEEYRRIQLRLADPRTIAGDAEAGRLIAGGKAVVLVTCSIHATEVGGTQMSLALAHRLATSDDPDVADILQNVILLLVPSLNPDGLIKVKRWYDSTLGTRHEGVNPPFLYHKYAGHDNNRDWYMFNLAETRLVVEHCLNTWYPHIVYDIHQTRSNGMRMVLPPFVDPVEPNVDPVLESGLAVLGSAIAAELTAQGKAGVAMNVVYDAFSPSRAYPHYHGGVRVLTETAGVQIATPVEVKPEDLKAIRGEHPSRRSWNHPLPWHGGVWTLRDIVDYNLTATTACLRHASRYRDTWLRNFYHIRRRAVAHQSKTVAYIVPRRQADLCTADEMVDVLRAAQVEVHEAQRPFEADGAAYRAGDRVVLLAQPNGQFAKAMLETQRYPDMRMYPGGPPKPPYDVTAHSLPIQMGVRVVEVRSPFHADLRPMTGTSRLSSAGVAGRLLPLEEGGMKVGVNPHPATITPILAFPPQGRRDSSTVTSFYFLGAETNASVRLVTRLLERGVPVERLQTLVNIGGATHPAGTYVVAAEGDAAHMALDLASEHGLVLEPLVALPDSPRMRLRVPRIGVYQSYMPSTEEGWTRFVLEEYGFSYESLKNEDMQRGKLADRFDIVVLPHQAPRQIERGHTHGTYPSRYTGGLGEAGAEALGGFLKGGGTLVAWDGAALYVIEHLGLPVTNVLADVPKSEFYAPGSLLEVELDTAHPAAYGMPPRAAVMFLDSPAFEVVGGQVVARYTSTEPLLSGWLVGPERLYGRTAMVVVDVGPGRAVLMGFRPHFRAQARGTYRLLFNSLLWSVARG